MVLNKLSHNACKVYSLTWSECSSSLTATALNLRNVEDLTDVTISAGGKIFPAHKLVLSSASPLLMELLKNTKCQHPILMLAGISAMDLEKILDFIYQGEINVDSETLPSLLQAAQFLDIRALSPSALVANSLPTPLPVPDVIVKKVSTGKLESYQPVREVVHVQNCRPQQPVAIDTSVKTTAPRRNTNFAVRKKRKAAAKVLETSKPKTAKSSFPSAVIEADFNVKKVDEGGPVSQPSPKLPASFVKLNEIDSQEDTSLDEKKIISDLPVSCKLCGITIRQSRNLRRHIDQRHSKPKSKLKDKEKKSELQPVAVENTGEQNDSNPALLDFSEDSFSQLTEEILHYSTNSESTSEERTFSNSLSVDSALGHTCLAEDAITAPQESTSSSSFSVSKSSVVNSSLSNLLEDNICFQLVTKNTLTSSTNTKGQDEPLSSESSSSIKNFECSNIEDSCNMNDMALKELENQLFSVCFCTVENDV